MDIYEGKRSDLWQTPQELWDKLNAQYRFNFDLAATKENAKVPFGYYTKEDNALTRPWIGARNWLNPPFSLSEQFFAKCAFEAAEGAQIVAIYKGSNMETAQWQDNIFQTADWIFVLRGRTNYFDPAQPEKNQVPFGSVLIGWNVPPPQGLDGTLLPLNMED